MHNIVLHACVILSLLRDSLLLSCSVKSVCIRSGIKILSGLGKFCRSESGSRAQAGWQRSKMPCMHLFQSALELNIYHSVL